MSEALRRRLLTFALVALVLLVVAAPVVWRRLTGPVAPHAVDGVTLIVPAGATTATVANQLRAQGLVRSALLFRLYVRRAGAGAELRPGRYRLSAAMGMDRLLAELRGGQPENNSFTVPEGYTLHEIADMLAARGFVASAAEFRRTADQSSLAAVYRPPGAPLLHPLEGYLFPDTYRVDPGASADELLRRMVQRTEQAFPPAYGQRAASLGLSLHQVLTLASIVEAEARLDSERPLIAGVYTNRLRLGMQLDADPTVQYATGKPPGVPPDVADLQVDSPYNTYRHTGLPPGPIGSPGDASIRAVLYPAATPYLYFVAKADHSGAHVFSQTLAEQNAAVAAQQGKGH